jgi:hypothetical protein
MTLFAYMEKSQKNPFIELVYANKNKNLNLTAKICLSDKT